MHNLQVTGDETQVLQSVLECDTEREKLLEEERKLLALTGHEGYTALIHKLVVILQLWSLRYYSQYSNIGAGISKLYATELPFWIIIFERTVRTSVSLMKLTLSFCLEVCKQLVMPCWHYNFR